MRYRNFDIELYEFEEHNGNESFSVRVTNSPAGDQSPGQAERMTLPDGLREETEDTLSWRTRLEKVIEYGEALAHCLLPSGGRQLFVESMRLLKQDEGVRLRLKFDAWQLTGLPWEFMYIARSTSKGASKDIDGFCALDRRVSIVRYEYTDYPLGPFNPEEDEALRGLVLLSSPKDFEHLDLESEAKNIGESLRSITNLNIEFLNNPTVEMLQEALDRPTHIFHYAGHGSFRAESVDKGVQRGRGFIFLCEPGGEGVLFPADKLALNLIRCGVRIAFLNSEYSAARDSSRPLSGVAPALVHAGVPAVIGLNGAITDQAAITFSTAFYRTLAAGSPVDSAVTNGRLAIFNQAEDDDVCFWVTPVLYLRAEDSTLFPIRPKRQKTIDGGGAVPGSLALRDMLVKHFNKDELKLLCADITGALNRDGVQQRVDLEIVGGDSLENIALNLIQHLERRGLLKYLIEEATAKRPSLLQTTNGN